ncbi:MAG: deoxyribose-phosphate aldolase, partial [Spirochaetales bacterium]
GMIDLSVLKPDNSEKDIKEMVSFAQANSCIAVFSLPAFVPDIVRILDGDKSIQVGGAVGFPSGGDMTQVKVFQTKELIKAGCTEIDMVVNVGKVKSVRYDYIEEEINRVIDAAGGAPVKVIFECHYLTDDEIRRLCELCLRTRAEYIKTGTGWAPTGATKENVSLMKSAVGDALKIKAAGGIRDLQTVRELNALGAVRFGVGLSSSVAIFSEIKN